MSGLCARGDAKSSGSNREFLGRERVEHEQVVHYQSRPSQVPQELQDAFCCLDRPNETRNPQAGPTKPKHSQGNMKDQAHLEQVADLPERVPYCQGSGHSFLHEAGFERLAKLVDSEKQCVERQVDRKSWSLLELHSQVRLERVADLLDRVQQCVDRQGRVHFSDK